MTPIKEKFNITEYVIDIVGEYSSIASIWLIGSRANETATENSDWDLLVFADQKTLENLKNNIKYHLPEVDLLVVYDGEKFQEPWTRKNEKGIYYKRGCLQEWKWTLIDNSTGRYKSNIGFRNAKSAQAGYTPEEKEFKAQRLWPN